MKMLNAYLINMTEEGGMD